MSGRITMGDMMSHPYNALPRNAFWKTAIGDLNALEIDGLWLPKFSFGKKTRIVTFGSCFAQHISRVLIANNYSWYDAEPIPATVPRELKRKFGYEVFSARTGNIYTARALLQWAQWALGAAPPPDQVWERQERFYDPFRPAIEPDGFASADEVIATRNATIRAMERAIRNSGVFVFTLGLTEAWEDRESGIVYAACPGTVAGTFDAERHLFKNFKMNEIHADMMAAMALMRSVNPEIKFLLTVSPVPLTATASDEHVLVATTYSKSVLRAVAGQLTEEFPDVDYFPSYEIITAPPYRGMFYSANMRTISPKGVDIVMSHFVAGLNILAVPNDEAEELGEDESNNLAEEDANTENDIKCEEELLEAFAR
ncbi:GSCFA domain-containing protein [Sphingobium ummariense]